MCDDARKIRRNASIRLLGPAINTSGIRSLPNKMNISGERLNGSLYLYQLLVALQKTTIKENSSCDN